MGAGACVARAEARQGFVERDVVGNRQRDGADEVERAVGEQEGGRGLAKRCILPLIGSRHRRSLASFVAKLVAKDILAHVNGA